MFWIWLQRHWPGWKNALVIVKPETVVFRLEGVGSAGLHGAEIRRRIVFASP